MPAPLLVPKKLSPLRCNPAVETVFPDDFRIQRIRFEQVALIVPGAQQYVSSTSGFRRSSIIPELTGEGGPGF